MVVAAMMSLRMDLSFVLGYGQVTRARWQEPPVGGPLGQSNQLRGPA